MSLYLLTVTLHLVAMVAWVGTMIAVPAILARGAGDGGALARQVAGPFRLIATPALLATWAFGIANAVQAGAFDYLDAPIERVGAKFAPLAFAPAMEQWTVPHAADVLEAVKRTVARS